VDFLRTWRQVFVHRVCNALRKIFAINIVKGNVNVITLLAETLVACPAARDSQRCIEVAFLGYLKQLCKNLLFQFGKLYLGLHVKVFALI